MRKNRTMLWIDLAVAVAATATLLSIAMPIIITILQGSTR